MGIPEQQKHEDEKNEEQQASRGAGIHWFRHGLRFHDNPALLEAAKDVDELYCIFIFDDKVAGENVFVFYFTMEKPFM